MLSGHGAKVILGIESHDHGTVTGIGMGGCMVLASRTVCFLRGEMEL